MTYDEVTLFYKFMQSKGVMNNFTYLYNAHRYDKRDLDTYLLDVDAEDAVLSAFDFSGFLNSSFGVKYWQEISQKWLAKLTEFRNTGVLGVEEQQLYCPHCGRLQPRSAFATKSNGVLHKHCMECEGGKWDKDKKEREKAAKEAEKQAKAMAQLEKEIAEKKAKLERLAAGRTDDTAERELENARQETARGQADIDKTTKVCSHCGKRFNKSHFDPSDTSEDGLQSWCRKCQTAAANVSAQADFMLERQEKRLAMIEKEQSYMVVKADERTEAACPCEPEVPTAPRLGEHDATLHFKTNEKRITLNAVLSEQVRKAGLTKCYVYADRKGCQFLVFNNAEGSNVTKTGSRTSDLLQVCSASICRQIAERFELRIGDNYYLHITKNLAHQQDIINIEVKQVRTREEYARIVQRREDVAKGKLPPYEALEDAKDHTDDGQAPATGESGGSPVPASEQAPLLDFGDDPSVPSSDPVAFIDAIVKAGHVTDRDLAAYLHQKGWELQEPVIVKKLKKFSL